MSLRTGLAWLGALACAVATGFACSGPPKGEIERKTSTRAPPGEFRSAGVSTVLERRCGSLDCHGAIGRNLRLYSERGLRLPQADGGATPGSAPTTIDEVSANYLSVMSLEPENTNLVLDGADPYSLLLVKKPLEIEKHKGGPALRRGDDAEKCIVSWLTRDVSTPVDIASCTRASEFPKEVR